MTFTNWAVTIRSSVTLICMAQTARAGFEQFYATQRQATIWFFIRRGVDTCHAEDLAAQVFEIVWQKWGETPNRKRQAWTYGVARNVLLAYQRDVERSSRSRQQQSEDSPPACTHVVANETARQVWSALAALSLTDRELLLAVMWDGLTPQAAAKALQLNAGTVRVRLHRARKRFAQAYGDELSPTTVDIRSHRLTGVTS